jgi:ribosomal protein S18 acetylase RimI-like enzyme
MTVTLRPESPGADDAFMRRLVLETIAVELGANSWPEPLRTQILDLQYHTRRQGPGAVFPEGQSRIILLDGEPVGWLHTATLEDKIWLAEVMVLPEFRGRGAGRAAVGEVLADAARTGKPVSLSVNTTNAGAIRLYKRLGFRRIGGTEVQHEMEARP